MKERPESRRYGYRSFDRQYVVADNRASSIVQRSAWGIDGAAQVFLTTLTSTKLGRGPARYRDAIRPRPPSLPRLVRRQGRHAALP